MAAAVRTRLAMQIVDTIKSICEHDINFIDRSGMICASTDAARIGDRHAIGLEAASTGETVEVERDDPARGVRCGINMPVRFMGEIVGVIGITGPPEEVRRYALLAQRVTLLLLREHDLETQVQYRRTRVGYVVRALTHGEEVNGDFLREVLTDCGIDPEQQDEGSWRTVVFRMNDRYNLMNISMIESQIERCAEKLGTALTTYYYPHEYIVIAGSGRLAQQRTQMEETAARFAGILQIGVGSPQPLMRQDASYSAAQLAIRSIPEGSGIAWFDELGLEILLADTAAATRKAYLARVLRVLDEEDRDLLETYFACGAGLKGTAEKLFVHKNTLQYRLNRIRERSGYDPRVFLEAVMLYAALRLRRISAD